MKRETGDGQEVQSRQHVRHTLEVARETAGAA